MIKGRISLIEVYLMKKKLFLRITIAFITLFVFLSACDNSTDSSGPIGSYEKQSETSTYYEIWASLGRGNWKPFRWWNDEPGAIYVHPVGGTPKADARFARTSGSGTPSNPFLGTWMNPTLGSMTFESYTNEYGYLTFTTTITLKEWQDLSLWY